MCVRPSTFIPSYQLVTSNTNNDRLLYQLVTSNPNNDRLLQNRPGAYVLQTDSLSATLHKIAISPAHDTAKCINTFK